MGKKPNIQAFILIYYFRYNTYKKSYLSIVMRHTGKNIDCSNPVLLCKIFKVVNEIFD